MKTIDYRFIQALSPKQGVCRAECIEAMADDYATGPGQTKNLRSLCDYDHRRMSPASAAPASSSSLIQHTISRIENSFAALT